jgi:drug/metabolite transporter (DMT)-like permease
MSDAAPSTFRGVGLVLLAVTCFAGQDTVVKSLTADYPPAQIIFLRYAVNALLLVLLLAPRHGAAVYRTHSTSLVIARAVCQGISSLCMGLAIQRLPVAEALSITLTAPLIVVILAGPLLRETVGLGRALAALCGFGGAVLILRPGNGLEPIGVVFAIGACLTFVVYLMLSRNLAGSETTEALVFHTAAWGTAVLGAACLLSGAVGLPDMRLLTLGFVVGLLATIGHFALTVAYRNAPASILAPLTYVQLVIVAVLAWVVFGHVPDAITALGMGIVLISGLCTGMLRPRR